MSILVVLTELNVAIHDTGNKSGVDSLAMALLLDELKHGVCHLKDQNMISLYYVITN